MKKQVDASSYTISRDTTRPVPSEPLVQQVVPNKSFWPDQHH